MTNVNTLIKSRTHKVLIRTNKRIINAFVIYFLHLVEVLIRTKLKKLLTLLSFIFFTWMKYWYAQSKKNYCRFCHLFFSLGWSIDTHKVKKIIDVFVIYFLHLDEVLIRTNLKKIIDAFVIYFLHLVEVMICTK